MKSVFFLILFVFCGVAVNAQSNELLNFRVEARIDYQHEYLDGKSQDASTGFKGKYLNFSMSGNISEEFSYAYRQRLNTAHANQSFFDATDWIYLTYKKGDWSFSAGKQVVGIGGYEYDRSPVDLYFCSEYWNNIPCYELGFSVDYQLSKKDKLMAQICESPFRKNDWLNEENEATYAYNLMWYGAHGWFNTIYSVNMMEYAPGKFINYIALGHKFDFGQFGLELDVMNRATDEHAFWGKNLSIMGELCWHACPKLNLMGKVTYDVNKTNSIADLCVATGTEITRTGGGIEFFPLKDGSKDIRLHAIACYTFGNNGNDFGVALDKQTLFEVGVTWRMNLLSLKK